MGGGDRAKGGGSGVWLDRSMEDEDVMKRSRFCDGDGTFIYRTQYKIIFRTIQAKIDFPKSFHPGW